MGARAIISKKITILTLLMVTGLVLGLYSPLFAQDSSAERKLPAVELTDEEQQWIVDYPVIRVHNEQDWPPFNYFENNKPQGFSIDYMNLLAELLEVKIEYKSGPSWNLFLDMIKKKELDVMLNIVKTENRQNYILFTDSYIRNPNVIVSSKANSYNTIEELYGKTVTIPEGFFYEEVLKDNYPQIKLLPLEDLLSCLKAVSFGDADAVMGEEAVVRTLIARNMLAGLEISGEASIGNPDYENLRIGVRNDFPLLRSALTKAMAAVTPQQMQELQTKWLSQISTQDYNAVDEDTGDQNWLRDSRIFIYITLVFLLLSLLSWIVIRTTKKKNIAINFGSKYFRLLTLIGLSIIITVIIIFGLLLLNRNRIETINVTKESLIITLENAEARLNLWIKQRTSYLERLGRDPELSNLVRNLLTVDSDKNSLISSFELEKIRTFYEKQQDEFPNIGFFVIDPDYISIGSRRDTNIGTTNLIAKTYPDLIEKAFQGEVMFVPPLESDVSLSEITGDEEKTNPPTMFFLGPIREADGNVIAVMTLRVDPSDEFSQSLQFSTTRSTSDTYAINGNGLMLSESRFVENLHIIGLIEQNQPSAMNVNIRNPGVKLEKGQQIPDWTELPLTQMAGVVSDLNTAQRTETEIHQHTAIETNTEGYLDYRGIEVFGSGFWSHELGLGLITEIDVDEALGPFYSLRITVLILLVVTISISVAAILFVLALGEKANLSLVKAKNLLEEKVTERTAALKGKQELLKEEEEKSRLLLESVGEGIFGLDTSGQITFVNPAAEKFLGYTREELIGHEVHSLIHHSHTDGSPYPGEECPMRAAYKDGKSHIITDEVLWRKDGSSFFVSYTSTPIMKQENLVGAVVTFYDVSDQKKAQEDINRLTSAMEQSPVSVVITDLKGNIQYVNPNFTRVTGYTYEEALGQNPRVLKSDMHDKDFYENMWSTIADGKTWEGELVNKKKNGENYWERASISAVLNEQGKIISYIAVKNDITEKKKADEQIKTLIGNIPGVVYRCLPFPPWTMFLVSDEIENLSGYPASEFLGKNPKMTFGQLIHPDDQENVSTIIDKSIKEKHPYEVEYRVIDRNNHIRWVYAKGQAIYNNLGKPEYLDGVIIDINDRKKAEEEIRLSESRFKIATESAKIATWEWFIKDDITIASPMYLELFGFDPQKEKVSEFWLDRIHPDDVEKTFGALTEHLEGKNKEYNAEFRYRHPKDEKYVWLWGFGKIVERNNDGSPKVVLGINQDITERKHLETEFVEAKEAADVANKAKSDFLANMSHEIRTPMNAIIGLDSLLAKTEMSTKQQDYVEKIGTSARNLLGIINDILDFSKIEAGKLEIENTTFVLNEVMDNLSGMIGEKVRDKGLELIFNQDKDVPQYLEGDPLRLGQILLNLTNNAIKFTEKGEIVVLSKLLKSDKNGIKIRFEVKDTGIGLTEEQVAKLFKSFSQADTSTTRKYGGTGLGLSISKKLVELMNGEIGVTSKYGKGSTFYFTVQLGIGEGRVKIKRTTPKDLKDLKVLVVDDNETARDVLTSYLEDFSFSVKSVSTGDLAIRELIQAKAAKDKDYDLVLMDYQMPGLNGIETSRKIREELENIEVPKIVMVTAFGREEIMRQAEKVGLQGFLIKPVSPSMMYDTIMEVFGKSSGLEKRLKGAEELRPEGFEKIRGAKLLLVEDNEINQQVAKETLEHEGFYVEVAEDGKVGVEKIHEDNNYDLVLMDLQMPVMDGYEATIEIRKDDRYKDLPIVAMTADAMIGVRDQVKEVGMNDYVTKPIVPKKLWEALTKWINPGERILPDGYGEQKKEISSEIIIPAVEGLNIEEGLAHLSGNRKLYLDLLVKFKDGYGETVKEIKEAIVNNDRELAVRLAHTVKGVAGNIGAKEVQQAAAIVEKALKDMNEDEKIFSHLDKVLSLLIEYLKQVDLEPEAISDSEDKKQEIDPGELKGFLEELKPILEKRKPKPAKEIIEKLKAYNLPEEMSPEFEKLSRFVSKYKFKDALIILENMREVILKEIEN